MQAVRKMKRDPAGHRKAACVCCGTEFFRIQQKVFIVYNKRVGRDPHPQCALTAANDDRGCADYAATVTAT